MLDALAPLVEQQLVHREPRGRPQSRRAASRALRASRASTSPCRPSERYADHLVFRSRPAAAEPRRRGARRSPRHGVSAGHLRGLPRRTARIAHGPGVLDMKGGLVVIAFALKALAATGGLDAVVPVRVVIVGDEEVGSPEGQGVIAAAIAGSSACLVFEAGRAGRRDHHAPQGHGRDDRDRPRTRGARGQRPRRRRERHLGRGPLRRRGAAPDRLRPRRHRERRAHRGGRHQEHRARPRRGAGRSALPDAGRRRAARRVGPARRATTRRRAVPGTRFELHGGIAAAAARAHRGERALSAPSTARARAPTASASEEAPLIGGGSDASTSGALGIPAIDGLGPRGTGFHTKDERIEVCLARPQGAGARALPRPARPILTAKGSPRDGVSSHVCSVCGRRLALVTLLGAAACPAPSDVTPPIRVDPKAAGRYRLAS